MAAVVADDAREVARRTLRGKFGRLANFAILARVKAAAGDNLGNLSDTEVLDRWFRAYDRAIEELRDRR